MVDRRPLDPGGAAALIFFGALLVLAASPAVAAAPRLDSFYLVRHHFALLGPALLIMLGVSLLRPAAASGASPMIGLLIALALTAVTLVAGQRDQGRPALDQSRRPLAAALGIPQAVLRRRRRLAASPSSTASARLPGNLIAILLYLVIVALADEPARFRHDLRRLASPGSRSSFWPGCRCSGSAAFALAGAGGVVGAYFLFPHVATRIDGFLDPATGDSYQVDRSLEAFVNGGLWGRGPGEGTVKQVLPDAHSDFVFAVAGEEFGLIACLLIVALFAFIVLRGYRAAVARRTNLFVHAGGRRADHRFRPAGGHQHGLDACI